MKMNVSGSHVFKTLVISCLCVVLLGCRKKSETSPASTTTKNYMNFKVNGVAKSAFLIKLDTIPPYYIAIYGIGISDEEGHLILLPDSIQTGTYNINDQLPYCSFRLNDSTTYMSNRGTLTLSSVGKTCEGTFDYIGYNTNKAKDSVFVTEGKFSFTP